jgi:hypothetical protein
LPLPSFRPFIPQPLCSGNHGVCSLLVLTPFGEKQEHLSQIFLFPAFAEIG